MKPSIREKLQFQNWLRYFFSKLGMIICSRFSNFTYTSNSYFLNCLRTNPPKGIIARPSWVGPGRTGSSRISTLQTRRIFFCSTNHTEKIKRYRNFLLFKSPFKAMGRSSRLKAFACKIFTHLKGAQSFWLSWFFALEKIRMLRCALKYWTPLSCKKFSLAGFSLFAYL